MSLEKIGDILAGPAATRHWGQIINGRIETLRIQIERMEAARAFLRHVLAHHQDTPPDGCPYYEQLIWIDGGADHPGDHADELPIVP
jgi:hypothetical protein